MRRINALVTRRLAADDGFTVVEVMVAMMVFAVLAVGVAAALTSSLVLSRDTRSREVASTLASDDLDAMRQLDSLFDVTSTTAPITKTVGGMTYTLTRTAKWSTSSGTANACGTGDGSLAFKNVRETVSWTSSETTSRTQSITMTSAIAPSSNVNSDTTGSILIGVSNAQGVGLAGITPTITGADTVTVPATDAEGCTHALGVTPGDYTVSLNRTGFIDSAQQNPSTQSVTVDVGDSSHAQFSYDQGTAVTFQYQNAGAAIAPNMSTTVVNTTAGASVLPNAPTSAKLFPYADGYRAIAGTYVAAATGSSSAASCLSPDPVAWTTPNAKGNIGVAPTSADPAKPTVAMGIITVKGLTSGAYLRATATTATTGSGDPGCAAGMTMTFARLSSTSTTVALPFGTWKLSQATSSTATGSTAITASASNVTIATNGAITAGNIMLDPRAKG